MPTGTLGGVARELPFQAPPYIRARVNFNDVGIASGIKVGRLPKDANIWEAMAKIRTTFNAGTTNVLTMGTNSPNYDNIMGANDINEGVAGSYKSSAGADVDLSAAEADVYVKYTQTGGAANQGVADLHVLFVPNNDR